MNSISKKLLRGLSSIEPKIYIEKASGDPVNGLAKVLFRTNYAAHRAHEVVANDATIERAFNEVLGDAAHLVISSVHKAEEQGYYYGFIKLNTKRVALEDAAKEGSGYHLVAANVFADDNDNIWDVQEDASGNKIIVRNSVEDLTELLTKVSVTPANMSVAAAGISLTSNLEFANVVTFLEPTKEEYHHGVVLDTAHAYDFVDKKVKKISPALVIAGTDEFVFKLRPELNSRMNGAVATVPELSSANVQDVINYLDTLYQNNPIFLAAYKDAVLKLIKI